MPDESDWVTLTDIMRRIGVPDTALRKSALSRRAAAIYRSETGEQARIEYGEKADGTGTHMLLRYPPSFVPTVERLIEEALTMSGDEQERHAPRPRRNPKPDTGTKKMRDATPVSGSQFWWAEGN